MRWMTLIALALAATLAQGTELKDFAGTWVMRIGARNLFVLTLTPESDGIRGHLDRPMKFSDTNGTFANMRGLRTDPVVHTLFKNGVLHLTIQNANDSKDEDAYAMTVQGDQAELVPDDLPPGVVITPFSFERATAAATVSTKWERNRLYVPGSDSDAPSAKMKTIFAEDQRVRMVGKVDWKVVGKTDEERRAETRKLLASGSLHTGKDYEEAAFVFQHGNTPQDYLLAHTLAMIAVSKGEPTAIWIEAATLDRYLEKIGQKQIFGTQYSMDAQHHWTQEPYDRELISDALRRQLGVPSQAIQAKQLRAYQTRK
jgi:hypothetical protein